MNNSKEVFARAEADDATGLLELLKRSPSHAARTESGETVFLYSLYRGKTKCVEALQKRGDLTLHEAAAAGDMDRVTACLDAAPWTIQSLSADGWSALHLAAYLGRDAVVVRLLDRGADALQWGRAFETNLPIHAACAGRRIGKAAFAKLVAATGDPDITPKHGYTPLMEAALQGSSEMIDVLLAAGADKTRKHPEGKTAAAFARDKGHADLAKRLD